MYDDVAGCLSAAGSILAKVMTFSILSKFREPVHCTTESFVGGLHYTRRGHWPHFVRLEGGRVHRGVFRLMTPQPLAVFCRWLRHIILWGLIIVIIRGTTTINWISRRIISLKLALTFNPVGRHLQGHQ